MQNALSAEEIRINELMGVNPHTYIESRGANGDQALNAEMPTPPPPSVDIVGEISRLMGISPAQLEENRQRASREASARAPLTEAECVACREVGVEPLDYWAAKMDAAGLIPAV